MGFEDEGVIYMKEENQETREVSEGEGWEAFRSIGRDAVEGKLPEASVRHDLYLYKGLDG